MFGFSLAAQIFQGSTQRTWNCVSNFANLIWGKFSHPRQNTMPRSRKRHHSRSRSRSRSRSHSRDRSYDRHKKNGSHEKDGKRRRVDEIDSPHSHKRSLSSESHNSKDGEVHRIEDVKEQVTSVINEVKPENKDILQNEDKDNKSEEVAENFDHDKLSCTDQDDNPKESVDQKSASQEQMEVAPITTDNSDKEIDSNVIELMDKSSDVKDEEKITPQPVNNSDNVEDGESIVVENAHSNGTNKLNIDDTKQKKVIERIPVSDSDDIINISDSDTATLDLKGSKQEKLTTPKKPLTPKRLQKKLESEKKRQQKQKEREERERQKQEEKEKRERQKQQKEEERLKQLEQKQKEKEMKEEQKKKEKEEKEQKRKEKEEQEAQKRKEKELEKLKKQQEIDEKNKEKQREEEKKQKTAALFVGFFKKTEGDDKEKKSEKFSSNFMPFEVKSDMRLPPLRRNPLSTEDIEKFDVLLKNQDMNASFLKDLKSGSFKPGKSPQTWPYEDPEDEVTIVDEDKILGETIDEDTSVVHKMKAKFIFFHENRRPAYFGTWRKKSTFIKPRKPFAEDTNLFNYEEDSDDDWEEEEQGESLDASGDEEDKETDNAEDDYEVDNDFFVPHGHLSDDEIDDEENARLSPESLKQKLKLLKDEFDEDIKSKTHKLKPRSIGCIWYNKKGDNIEDAIKRYLQPFAMIVKGQIEIKDRSEIFLRTPEKKKLKVVQELPSEHIPYFLKIIHGNVNKKKTLIEQFLTYMANNGLNVDVSKANLTRFLKQVATYRRCKKNGPIKNKFAWLINDEMIEKYNVNVDEISKIENKSC